MRINCIMLILVIILDLLISVFTTNDNVVGIDCVVQLVVTLIAWLTLISR
jgi:hypothetical protein